MCLKKICFAGLLLAASAPVFAAQGEVCQSAPDASPAGVMPLLSDSSVFQCKSAGSVTVPQLYSKGWRVVSAFPQTSLDAAKPGVASVVWTLIVEKL